MNIIKNQSGDKISPVKHIILLVLFFISTISYSQPGVFLTEDFESGVLNPDYNLNCYESNTKFSIQSSISRNGNYAASFENLVNEGKRCEMTLRRIGFFKWGEERWMGYSINIPYTPTGNGVMSQHHSVPGPIGDPDWNYSSGANGYVIRLSDDKSKFAIRLIPSGAESLNYNAGGTVANPLPGGASQGTNIYYEWPLVHDKWIDVVLNFRYSDGDDGFFKVWINGELVIDITGSNVHLHDVAGRLKEKENYFQFGIYPGTEGKGKIFYDEIRIGDETSSYEDVAPRAQTLAVPSSLIANDSTSSSISLSWTPSTENVGIAEYDVFRDGAYVGTTSANEFTDTLLSATTTYSYTVLAREVSGEETAQSAAMTVTTLQSQNITITPIEDKLTNDPPFYVEAVVNTSLPLTYEVTGPATISGKTITLDGGVGTVEVTVTQAGDATYGKTSKTSSFEVMLITGLEGELPTLKIYPIPATDWLNIEGDYSENAKVQIIDIMGKQVLFETLRGNSVSVSNLPVGTYALNIIDKGFTSKAKIIVQR